jgi:hypothetical protein
MDRPVVVILLLCSILAATVGYATRRSIEAARTDYPEVAGSKLLVTDRP